MKLVSYLREGHDQLGIYVDGFIYDMESLHPELPGNMNMFLQYWEDSFPTAQLAERMVKEGRITRDKGFPIDQAYLLAPVPFPSAHTLIR